MEEVENKKKFNKRKFGFILGLIGSSLGFVILFLVGYVGSILLGYYRIGNKDLEVNGTYTKEKVNVGEELTALTYNIGFGAYSQDFTFFLDDGFDEEGNVTCGTYSTGKSYDEVMFNVNGSLNTIKNQSTDFIMLQEVDIDSTRSYRINQDSLIKSALTGYNHSQCTNFHSSFLPYPLYDMHGEVNSGLSTFSKYKIESAARKQYTVADNLSKLFDLDRCFAVHTLSTSNNKTLYIVNSHMSAYDEGGKIREKQMEELNAFLIQAKEEGAYVIIGADFNHDLLTYNPSYKVGGEFKYTEANKPYGETKKNPTWVAHFFSNDGTSKITSGYSVHAADNLPTCRNNDIPWENGKTYVTCIDGFITSDNISVSNIEVIATNNGNLHTNYFAYSDHQPVKITFTLNA